MAPGILIEQPYDYLDHAPSDYNNDAPQPDISWVPSLQSYLERSRILSKCSGRATAVPIGFPKEIQSDMVWDSTSTIMEDFVHELTPVDIQELESALRHFEGLQLTNNDISPITFPLDALAAKLASITVDVHKGKGCAVLRGLNPSNYTLEQNVIIYAGIASYIGAKRGVQDEKGTVLTHIKDLGSDFAPDDVRQSPYASNAQPFHNDTCDVLCMYAMDRAQAGGRSMLASVATVYNEIAATRPDLIHILSQSAWPFDCHTDPPTYFRRPILFHHDQRVYSCFSRRPLTGSNTAPRLDHLPPLTEAQAEALDAVHFTALKHSIPFQLERGDMQFFNNLAILHGREAFGDEHGVSKRHLIRLWVRNEQWALPTPDSLTQRWAVYYGGTIPPVWDMAHSVSHVVRRKNSCIG